MAPKRASGAKSASAAGGTLGASPLHTDLAYRILQLLKEQRAAPGHHLVEQALSRHFGLSRTPIRGALKLLAARGILQARTHRGYILRAPVDAVPEVESLAKLRPEEHR